MDTSQLSLGETVVSAAAIASRVGELGRAIDHTHESDGRPLILVCVLKGSLFFTADLARALTIPVELDCVVVRSYGDRLVSTGSVRLVKDVELPVRGRDVMIVEDVIDTGRTTAFLRDHIERLAPHSLRLVSLLNKLGRREKQVRLDFAGFDIPDRFVVGYGLDFAERYRNLPDIRALNPPPEAID